MPAHLRVGWIIAWLTALLSVVGCRDFNGAAHIKLKAVIEGQVEDGVTGEPISGLSVELSELGQGKEDIGERTTTTDSEGRYQFIVKTTGTHSLSMGGEAENGKTYARMRTSMTVDPNDRLPDSTSGTFVIGLNGDSVLYPLTGSLKGNVYGSNQRDAISEARVIVRYFSGGIEDPSLPREVMTDEDGKFELEDLPAGVSIQFQVRPSDRDGDGVADTQNWAQNISLEDGVMTEHFLGPVSGFNNPAVIWHNVDSTRTFSTDPSFVFMFRTPMDTSPSSATVRLQDQTNGVEIATTPEWDSDGLMLTVEPASKLKEGRDYRILISAWSQEATQVSAGWINFRTEGGADDEPTPEKPVLLQSQDGINYFSTNFLIGVTAIDGVDQYWIYARIGDNDWSRVETFSPQGQLPYERINVNISGSELRKVAYPDNTSSLFASEHPLELAAAAVVGGVPGPLSPALEIEDMDCPTAEVRLGTNTTPNSYWDNTDGEDPKPLIIQLRTNNREAFAFDAKLPTLMLDSGPFDSRGTTLEADDFEAMRIDRSTIEYRAELPPGEDASLMHWMLDLSDLTDPAGNEVCETSFQGYTPGQPGFGGADYAMWSFESDDQGFSGSGSVWERGEATGVGPTTGGWECTAPPEDCTSANFWGTTLDGARPDDSDDVLSSPRFRTPDGSTLLIPHLWLQPDTTAGDSMQIYFIDEEDDDAEYFLVNYTSGAGGWSTSNLGGMPNATWGHLEFRFSSGTPTGGAGTSVAPGYYVDDIWVRGVYSVDIICNDILSCPR